jgi:transposase
MDPRKQKALEIVSGGKITRTGDGYFVPSQGGKGWYKVVVDGLFPNCSCEDFELTGQDCKHMLAVKLWLTEARIAELNPNQPPRTPSKEPAPRQPRKTYPQDWPAYNAAQNNEKRHFQELLADLCRGIAEPPPKAGGKGGRPPVPLRDAVFAAAFKVYCGFSARRFVVDLGEARGRGHLSRPLCHNSVLKALENPDLTPVLQELIYQSARPLSAVETKFAVDSTGFCTSRFVRFFDVKYGTTRQEAEWVKVHITTGVKTNVVTAAEILGKYAGDAPQLPGLVRTTRRGFRVDEVSADKAYAGTENFQAVEDAGGTLYAAFRSNTTGSVGGIFEKMFHYFQFMRDEYLTHYHLRSNVESTFSAIKRKFGDSVRSKTDTAMKNEVFCKLICQNICCLIAAVYELGIEPVFWKDDLKPGEEPDLIPFPGVG